MKLQVVLFILAVLALSACAAEEETETVQDPLAATEEAAQEPLPLGSPLPLFEGELNGIRFTTDTAYYSSQNICAELGLLDEWRQSADNALVHELAKGTPMEIIVDPASLPADATEVSVEEIGEATHKKCGEHVARIMKVWRTPRGVIEIVKEQGAHIVPFTLPAAFLKAVTVNGKPAVLEGPYPSLIDPELHPEDTRLRLFIAEDFGLTIITTKAGGIRIAGLLKIAEGVR